MRIDSAACQLFFYLCPLKNRVSGSTFTHFDMVTGQWVRWWKTPILLLNQWETAEPLPATIDVGGVFSFDVRKLKSPGNWSHHIQHDTAHWSRKSWDLLGQCLQSAKHAGNYAVATIGKRPSYGCHGKVGPLLWASTPCPSAISTIHFYISP